ncbi:hypothetical protein JCM11491_007225 [Sporobolomyces phaffii]
MAPPARPKPAPPTLHYNDSSSGNDLEPSSKPAPATLPSTTKPPSVFKTKLVKPDSPTPPGRGTEALVKPSTKTVDQSRGQYAPVPLPTAPPSSSSEFSDFSDLERQYPTSQRQQQRAKAHRVARDRHVEEMESEEEQEEEKEGRPAQTPAERRKRLKWALIAGGISIIVIIIIIVTILLLHSGDSAAPEPPSQTLNATSGADHSGNSTMSSDARNSTASRDPSLSHASKNSMSASFFDGQETATALPTHASSTLDLADFDSSGQQSQFGAFETIDSDDVPTRTTESVDDISLPSPVNSSGGSLVDFGSTDQLTDYAWHHTHLYSDVQQASASAFAPLPTPVSSTRAPAGSTPAVDSNESDQRPSTEPPSREEEADADSSASVLEPATSLNGNQSPLPTLSWIGNPAPAASFPAPSFSRPLPTEYLRPLPVPQATDDVRDVVGPGDVAQPSLQGSALGPVPTFAPKPDDTVKNASTKWIGKATWFSTADAPRGCHLKYRETDFAVALSEAIYGSSGSVSTFCGAKLYVWNAFTNQTRLGTVVGACSDCEGPTDINLSESLFAELDDPEVAVLDVQWWFEDPLVERQTTTVLSRYESTAEHGRAREKYETTAIFWSENGWNGSCGKVVEDDSMYLGLPLELWPDPSSASEHCGQVVTVKNLATGTTIQAEVVEASNRTDYTTFTRHAFEELGGVADEGELAVEFSFD